MVSMKSFLKCKLIKNISTLNLIDKFLISMYENRRVHYVEKYVIR